MTHGFVLFIKVQDFPQENVYQHAQVVRVEIFGAAFCREQEVQDLEHE